MCPWQLSSTLGPRYYHPTTGARKLFSQLGRHVADDLSGAYLDGEIDDGSTVVMKPDDNNQQPFLLRFPA
jgi:ATP-dependent Clp protease ATP-binding subunit ClpA